MNNQDLLKTEDFFIKELSEDSRGHIIERGTIPILLSAPHSVSQIRNNNVKAGEFRTGIIVKSIAFATGCAAAYKTKCLNDDANYDEESLYKTDLLDYINQNKVLMMIDLHLSHPDRAYDIDIGTGYGNNILDNDELLTLIHTHFTKYYNTVKIDDTFPASYPHTVAATVSRIAGIPAFQLEINWSLVSNLQSTNRFMEQLGELITLLEAHLCTDGLYTTEHFASQK